MESPSPHFSRPVRYAHSVPIRQLPGSGLVSRESIGRGKLLPKLLATGDPLTNLEIL
jgi:hypothetical protein